MSKIDPEFQHDIYKFLHKPLMDIDRKDGDLFLERFLQGAQIEFEEMQRKLGEVSTLNDPATIRADLLQYLKSHVGFTSELDNITNDLSENDLRKLIALAVALWKTKGTEPGYSDIIRLFVGKSARIFNWFDFRFIVGEQAFGEEQLGADAWFISRPGVEDSQPLFNVLGLYTFENNVKDKSEKPNDAIIHSPYQYYTTPSAGYPLRSTKYLHLDGGCVEVRNSAKYDLSGNVIAEVFFRSKESETEKVLFNKMDANGKGFKVSINKATNEVSYEISDGAITISDSITTTADLDDGVNRHIALVIDRDKDGVRLYVGGSESTAKTALGALGDLTNQGRLYIGGEAVGVNTVKCDLDNFRLVGDTIYDVDSATVTQPLVGFIEYQEEQLDEFKTDIRIVDDGSGLNKTLILRILNLMRPISERIRVIFIKFFEDFLDGIGQFNVPNGSAVVNVNRQMELSANTLVHTSVLNDDEFQDIVLQVKANDTDGVAYEGGIFSVLFFFTDVNNYYEFRIDTKERRSSLWKRVGGLETQISPYVSEDIVPKASYIYTVATDLSVVTGETTIKAYIDSNKHHEIVDGTFVKGKFGMKTDSSTIMQIDEIEMMEVPMDVRIIEPGFDL